MPFKRERKENLDLMDAVQKSDNELLRSSIASRAKINTEHNSFSLPIVYTLKKPNIEGTNILLKAGSVVRPYMLHEAISLDKATSKKRSEETA